MKKKRLSRRFSVHASVDNLELTKAGTSLKLIIESKGERLGELQIGRGSLFWWGANRRLRKRVDWARFADELNRMAYGHK